MGNSKSFSESMSFFRRQLGLLNSLLVYYAIPFRIPLFKRLYAQFINPGDLCFDIGAHVGDRVLMWIQLGAQVVAVEPIPDCMRLLKRFYGHRSEVTLVEMAVGATIGYAPLFISQRTPTVSSLSTRWLKTVQSTPRFQTTCWEESIQVPVTTLDTLIEKYGEPAFCKIDVEGYELEVLRGLTHPVKALSFEYQPILIHTAIDCIDRLEEMARYEYNWTLSEFPRLISKDWVSAVQMQRELELLSPDHRSGDIYARL